MILYPQALAVRPANWICLSLLSLLSFSKPLLADNETLVFAALTAQNPPIAIFSGEKLTAGIVKDLGEAIALRLQRKAVFLPLSRNRLVTALKSGQVDGICYSRPEWLGLPLHWTAGIIPNSELLLRHGKSVAPFKISDAAGATIGTVLSFRYPELDTGVAGNYTRDDAPSMGANIRKFIAGRFQYAMIDRLSLNYAARLHPELNQAASLSLSTFVGACGFSLKSTIPFNEVERAVKSLLDDGTVKKILAHYEQD
ncbi:substrate-binding periplasmic protein [Undibacterium sp. Ren11W]